jgi:hypothetical protein
MNLGDGDAGIVRRVNRADVSIPDRREMFLSDAHAGIRHAKVLAFGEATAKRFGGPGGRELIGEYLGDVVDETASVGQYVNVRSEFVDLIRFIGDVVRGRRLARSSAKKTRREHSRRKQRREE